MKQVRRCSKHVLLHFRKQVFVYNPLDFKDLLGDELTQRKEEGYDNSHISDLAERTLQFALANTDASRKE